MRPVGVIGPTGQMMHDRGNGTRQFQLLSILLTSEMDLWFGEVPGGHKQDNPYDGNP